MIVTEGQVSVDVPEGSVIKGPGKKSTGFYNYSQKLNRDLTLLFLSVAKPSSVLDGFGGSGIRGIRIEKELGIETFISEINPASFEIIEKNAKNNNSGASCFNESFEKTLGRKVFDYIDVDPYGSVIPFIDRAITSVRNRGHVAVTATDLSALTGSVPAKTRRRYSAHIRTDSFKHEMGIRLLIAYAARRGAAFDISLTPEVSLWHSHFYRVIFKVEHGAGKADRMLENIGHLNKSSIINESYADEEEGPVWKGRIQDPATMKQIARMVESSEKTRAGKYIELLMNEDASVLFLELSDIARHVKSNVPPLKAMTEKLAENGIKSFRTHFSPTGIKVAHELREAYTDAASFMEAEYRE